MIDKTKLIAATVNNRKANAELVRIQWRASLMAEGRIEELRTLARNVKYQERLTYDPDLDTR